MVGKIRLWKADAPLGESAWIEDLFFEEFVHSHALLELAFRVLMISTDCITLKDLSLFQPLLYISLLIVEKRSSLATRRMLQVRHS